MRCPLCEVERPDLRELSHHFFNRHGHVDVGSRQLRMSHSQKSIQCWCRGWFRLDRNSNEARTMPTWHRHLEREGGLDVHMLTVILTAY
jgi:hypothetical protein